MDPGQTDVALRFVEPLFAVHGRLRARVRAAFDGRRDPTAVADDAHPGDTIYAIDEVAEDELLDDLDHALTQARTGSVLVVGEGLPAGTVVGGAGEPRWRMIVDPVDGTRGLMYQKRSAWALTGVAPERGAATGLADVAVAVQTEIPVAKQDRADRLWAVGPRWGVEREDLRDGTTTPVALRPSSARTIEHGYVSVSRFFPGGRDLLASVDDDVVERVLGPAADGKARCFEDQYASTGGQLYELLAGHDRVVVDLRPLLAPLLTAAGRPAPLCCHPYDLATASIATAAGVVVTSVGGGPLDAPLEVEPDVAWAGYANAALRDLVEPALLEALAARGLR